MGNKLSTEFLNGDILIMPDQTYFNKGDDILGKIHLDIREPFIYGDELVISFEGVEEIQYYISSNNSKRPQRQKHFVRNPFFSYSTTIFKFFDKEIPFGNYTFPFKLHIPNNEVIKPSFCREEVRGGQELFLAKVNYSLKAFVKTCADAPKSLSSSIEINLTDYSKSVNKESIQPILEKETNLFSFCFLPRGTLKQKITTDKDIYSKGEIVKVNIEVSNKRGQIPLKNGFLTLYHKVKFANRDFVQPLIRTLYRKQLPDLSVGDELNILDIPIPLNKVNENEGSIKCSLFQSQYFLHLKFQPKNFFDSSFNEEIEKEISVSICSPFFPLAQAIVVPPSYWNPKIMPIFSVELGEKNHANLSFQKLCEPDDSNISKPHTALNIIDTCEPLLNNFKSMQH